MIELPEAANLARQLRQVAAGRVVDDVAVGHTPHRFAWFQGDPNAYPGRWRGRPIGAATHHGGFVVLEIGEAPLAVAEGVALRWCPPGSPRPTRHQLLLTFGDGAALAAAVGLYGFLLAVVEGEAENPYLARAREAPAPWSAAFDESYWTGLVRGVPPKTPLKALLASEQRIPGFGNGVLQDVLFEARLHPRRRVASLSDGESERLWLALRTVLTDMARHGGRGTERDLFGEPGGYATRMTKRAAGGPCPRCGASIVAESFLGGTVVVCPACQPR